MSNQNPKLTARGIQFERDVIGDQRIVTLHNPDTQGMRLYQRVHHLGASLPEMIR